MAKLRLGLAVACLLSGFFWIVESHLMLPVFANIVSGWHLLYSKDFSDSSTTLLVLSLFSGIGVALIALGISIYKSNPTGKFKRGLVFTVAGTLGLLSLNFLSYNSLPKDDLLTYKMPMGNCGGVLSLVAQKTANPFWIQATRELSNVGTQYLFRLQDETCAELRISDVVREKELTACKKMGFETRDLCMDGLAQARDEFYTSTVNGRVHRASNWVELILSEVKHPNSIASEFTAFHLLSGKLLGELQKATQDYPAFASSSEIERRLHDDGWFGLKIRLFSMLPFPQMALPLAYGDTGSIYVEYVQSASTSKFRGPMIALLEGQFEALNKQNQDRSLASDNGIQSAARETLKKQEALFTELKLEKSEAELNLEQFKTH